MVIKNRTETDYLIVHCSATTPRQDIGVKTINGWHLQRGIYSPRGLSGYHYVIRRSGLIELGRDLMAIGAHCLGRNAKSVGICLVGGVRKALPGETPQWDNGMVADNNFKGEQFDSLKLTLTFLRQVFPSALVAGHGTFDNKACPSFDVWEWQNRAFGYNDKLKVLEAIAKGDVDDPESEPG